MKNDNIFSLIKHIDALRQQQATLESLLTHLTLSKQLAVQEQTLESIAHSLKPISQLAQSLLDSGLLENLAKHLPEIIQFIHRTFPTEQPKMYMPDVLRHLGISDRTYYRKVADGKLKPRKWEGPDFFYRSDLEEQWKESKRRGRI